MADLTDDQLARIEAHSRGGLPPEDGEHYVEVLVAEVRRLREERDDMRAALALKNSYDRVLGEMTGDYLEAEARCSELEAERDRLRDGIRLHRTRLGPMAVEADRRLYALLCDGMPLDNSCPICGGGPVVDGVCRDDHHHDDQEDNRG